jgi:Putative peptidoglycan binding domain
MSPIRPHVSSGPGRVTNSRPALSNVARNRGVMASTARQSRTFPQRGLNGRTDHIAERHDANWHGDWDRRHAHFDHGHFFVFVDGFWCGLDAGFFPWDYYPYYGQDYYPYDYYTADVPQYDNDNTEPAYDDNGVPVPDSTVQAVQTQLTQQGYYNGPADGIFGPTTRDAVAKYQIAKNLNVTGSLSPDMLQSLGLPRATSS